jgi:autoinducer 2 (AI-2) kinase
LGSNWLLGLDLGGGSIRCVALDTETGHSHVASQPFSSEADPDAPAGTRFDPARTRERVRAAVAGALAMSGATPDRVAGLACASMRHASVVLDAQGEVLLATDNRDARGAGAMIELGASHGERFAERTGHWPHPVLPAGRLRWLASERPDLLERAAAHLSISDWLGAHWTGELASDPTQAGESLCLDLATRSWADDLIREHGLPREIFPALREPGSRLGSLREAAARELGLPAGLPVAVAGGDTPCALLGSGALAPGQTAVVAGTTAPVERVQDRPVVDPRLWASPASLAGRFLLESNAGPLGESLAWLAAALFGDRPHPLLHLLEAAGEAPGGAGGLLSSLGGDVMDARAPELPIGQLVFSPLLAPDAAERTGLFARAALEGLAFAVRANLEQLDGEGASLVPPLLLAGGLGRSAVFAQLVADVCDVPVSVPRQSEATAIGAALCAGVGAGVFASLPEAVAAVVVEGRRFAPDPSARDTLREGYFAWSQLREAQAPARAAATGHALRHLLSPGAGAGGGAADVRPSVLVASDMDPESLASLRELAEVEYASFRDAGRLLTGDALVDAVAGVDVFVTEIDVVNAEALVRCRDLRVIAVCRGDAVNVDLAAATALGIPVLHTPGRNADAVADLTLGFLISLARKLPAAGAFLREPGGEAGDLGRMGKAFVSFQGRELWHRTVGLVGLGAVGRRVVARLRPFGARCLVHDPFVADDAIRLAGAEPVPLDTLLEQSDFVSLHAAVTDDTRGLVGKRELARMPAGSFLVNTARAALVQEDALLDALTSGHLGGAALDVFAVEPPASDHPLLALPNVIATPHIGGNTTDVAAHQGAIVLSELGRLLRGERPRHVLNPETLGDFSWTRPRPGPPPDLLERLAQQGDRKGPAVTDLERDKPKGEGSGGLDRGP